MRCRFQHWRRLGWALLSCCGLTVQAADELVVTCEVHATGSWSDQDQTSRGEDHLTLSFHGEKRIDLSSNDLTEVSRNSLTVQGGGFWEVGDALYWAWTYRVSPQFDPNQCEFFTSPTLEVGTVAVAADPQGWGGNWWEAVGEPGMNLAGLEVANLYLGAWLDVAVPKDQNRFSVTVSTNFTSLSDDGKTRAQLLMAVTVARNMELEAVIIPNPEGPVPGGRYEDWLPAAHDDGTPGTNLFVSVELRTKGSTNPPAGVRAKFHYQLLNASREPGICLNFPLRAPNAPPPQNELPDLRLEPTFDHTTEDQGLTAHSTSFATEDLIEIASYDYGGYGELQVTAELENSGARLLAHLEGDAGQQLLRIPKDENGNHVADAWETQMGVLGKNLPAAWDGVDSPAAQKTAGDGISLYERYRGFKFQGLYERLVCNTKYAFVSDPDGFVALTSQNPDSAASSFPSVSGCRTRYVDDGEWTGTGPAGTKRRTVNFNTSGFGHAVDQHALRVEFNFEEAPVVPPEWDQMWKTNVSGGLSWAATNSLAGVLGMAWPDYSSAPLASPKGTLLITVYPPLIRAEARAYVFYHTLATPPFTNYGTLPPADQQRMLAAAARAADQYIAANPQRWQERFRKRLADVSTHELGHGLGISHHVPTEAGNRECVMRYFADDCPPNPADRFELSARAPWPDIYCRGADHTAGSVGCWMQIKVTDR